MRLPSRGDPTKDGARIWFPKPLGVQVRFPSDKIRAPYGSFTLKTVPHEQKQDTELYVADFTQVEPHALDDFTFIDEAPILPRGIIPVKNSNGEMSYVPNKIGQLVLPPMPDRSDWGNLWDKHGIMIKWNPTIHQNRFVNLNYDSRRSRVDDEMRRFNSGQANGRMFMRALAVYGVDGMVSLNEVVKTALSEEKLSLEELLLDEKRR